MISGAGWCVAPWPVHHTESRRGGRPCKTADRKQHRGLVRSATPRAALTGVIGPPRRHATAGARSSLGGGGGRRGGQLPDGRRRRWTAVADGTAGVWPWHRAWLATRRTAPSVAAPTPDGSRERVPVRPGERRRSVAPLRCGGWHGWWPTVQGGDRARAGWSWTAGRQPWHRAQLCGARGGAHRGGRGGACPPTDHRRSPLVACRERAGRAAASGWGRGWRTHRGRASQRSGRRRRWG